MKNQTIIFIVLFILITVIIHKFFIEKMNALNLFAAILQKIKKEYGAPIAENVEKIYRLETANLTSKQFLGTYSPGMMAFSDTFPYGWTTLNTWFWADHPEYKPIGIKVFEENPGLSGTGGGLKKFVLFKSLKDAAFTLAGFLKIYGNNPGRWYSNEPTQQAAYNQRINLITPIYT